MKKTMMRTALAGAILTSALVGQSGNATAAAATATPTVKPAATTAPIMRDNLFKFGLKKAVELPVTVTAGGFSYTLEKIMIYDVKSATAQTLIKKYGYTGTDSAKYFIWTKITVENKSGNTVQKNYKDLNEKWELNFGGETSAYVTMPLTTVDVPHYKPNNKEALWSWSLKAGEKLSTYQAYLYDGKFNSFVIWLDNKNVSTEKYVAKNPKE
ncbi:hypothetical protein [Paenibacillus sp. S150]|uniref:hypothetical protein n=1 Tax=Paenibacillus sp. S150 TaxID=2749826 RepID=UPI001C563DE5|nr:hypothetical protein [Paenibacillus sp. S150]MBW4083452.1 hypothetical protein [Paenibacillus sp. S150]